MPSEHGVRRAKVKAYQVDQTSPPDEITVISASLERGSKICRHTSRGKLQRVCTMYCFQIEKFPKSSDHRRSNQLMQLKFAVLQSGK